MSDRLPAALVDRLSLPVIAAPMFLVTGPEMVIAACRAGLIGAFPAPNCRTLEDLDDWMTRIAGACGPSHGTPPWALNIVVHRTYPRLAGELDLILKHKPALVITALGSPANVIEAVHSYGGLVFADVNSVRFARKAAAAGVDGLILVSAGAGGHCGPLAGFAFLPEVRRFWDGPIVLAGAISDGRAVRAAEILGADLAYVGTRFIAAQESLADPEYRQMLVEAGAEDVTITDRVSGVPANFLVASMERAGFDPAAAARHDKVDFSDDPHDDAKAWKDIWAAGQGVGAVDAIEPLADIAGRLKHEYAAAVADGRRPNRWLDNETSAAAE